jgi:hypothetical protein
MSTFGHILFFFMPAMVRDGIWGSETITETGRGGQRPREEKKEKKIAD